MSNRFLYLLLVLFVLAACKQEGKYNVKTNELAIEKAEPVVVLPTKNNRDTGAVSLSGKYLISPEPSPELQSKLDDKKQAYYADTSNLDNLIWYGRFLAYAGQYGEAIKLYTDGIDRFPDEPRLYRHRGHRYITLRKFRRAISDFEQAKLLMEGMPIQVEEDGMPNEQNIPVSSLQSNVLYHLGLAYYLINDLDGAEEHFTSCMNLNTNDDNYISAMYWKYMIMRRGGAFKSAKRFITEMKQDLNIIENHAYHKICLFYQQSLSEYDLREFSKDLAQPSKTAINYAIANWNLFQNKPDIAQAEFRKITRGSDWSSFGFIAAEADLQRF